MKTVEEIKADLLDALRMDELLNPDRDKAEEKKLADGMRSVPIAKLVRAAQYLEHEIIPRVAKRGGKESEDYKFFSELILSLTHAMMVYDRYDFLHLRYIRMKVILKMTQEHCAFYEDELLKYTTLEDLMLSDALRDYAEAISKRMLEKLKTK
jgi:hypothetical protein